MEPSPYCISSFLAFRYVVDPMAEWKPGIRPVSPDCEHRGRHGVRSDEDVLERLKSLLSDVDGRSVGLLLSSGIDSAILAALLPPGIHTYTAQFEAEGALDEAPMARRYAEICGHRHRVVRVTWDDYLAEMDSLMSRKRSPLHPVEIGIFEAARSAAEDGVRTLIVGNGADSTFGGMDKLLSKDWTFDQFVDRYTFLDPARVASRPFCMRQVYEPFRANGGIDVQSFLKTVHGRGIVQTFENAVSAAGCDILAPFEELSLAEPLDIRRIRGGEPKYTLRKVFERLYPGLETPRKIPFSRPMDQWMKDCSRPRRPEFQRGLEMETFTGEQKWLMFILGRFLDLMDGNAR